MPAWIVCGVAGSGKTTLAGRLVAKSGRLLLDADDFHPKSNIEKMKSGQALNDADREGWLTALEQAIAARPDAVLAFPGLKAAHRERISRAAGQALWIFLRVTPEEAKARLAGRGGFFPPALVESQFAALEAPSDALSLDAKEPIESLEGQSMEWLTGQTGLVGLGRMGLGFVRRLHKAGIKLRVFDTNVAARRQAAGDEVDAVDKLEGLQGLNRVILSLPAGEPTETTLKGLKDLLPQGALVIDTANAHFKDSQRRAKEFEDAGFNYMDAGVSGGLRGKSAGYCVTTGCRPWSHVRAMPLMAALAAPNGLLHCGPAGAGHYVKMAHNAIEYGMMQSFAEGFEILKTNKDFRLDLARIAKVWKEGAVIRSFLLELAEEAFLADPELSAYKGVVGSLGTGEWAAKEAHGLGLKTPTLDAALDVRENSKDIQNFATKFLSALRERFGGHKEAKA